MQVTQEATRRTRIVEATIEVLAELGYAKTTFAKINEKAGMSSTRLISYHFANKSDLMMQVLITVLARSDELLEAKTAKVTERAELLRAYILAEVELIRTRPTDMTALLEVGSTPEFLPVLRDAKVGRLRRQLEQGQREGVFGAFDLDVMATTIRRGIDGAAERLAADPKVDLKRYGRELAALFARATSAAVG